MKYSILILLLLFVGCVVCEAQTKIYKEYNICVDSAKYKGKANHGKYHCTGQAIIRQYKDGRKDTIAWTFGGSQIFIGEEYEQYQKLSERSKYIVDSLKEDGIPMFQNDYLIYEPIYMKSGKKTYKSWSIQGEDVIIYYYSIWKNSSGNGVELIKKLDVN